MIRFALFSLLLALPLLLTTPVQAQDSNVIQDSLYFTLDDGMMTPEEMEKESMFVYGLCANNGYQQTYFNCECVAGAFLIQREKLGPMVPQNDIVDGIVKSDKATCANSEGAAGKAYEYCRSYAYSFRELETDNESYCTCVANKVANDFTKRPALDVSYIENITIDAMGFCESPQNRKKTGKAPDPRTLN